MKISKEEARLMAAKLPYLRYGSKGWYVEMLQTMLNKVGYKIAIDGIFGRQTLAAVKDFQAKHGLRVDGIVGINTWTKLIQESGITPILEPQPNQPPAIPAPIPSPTPTPKPSQPIQAGTTQSTFEKWLPYLVIGGIAYLLLSE